MLDLNRTFFHLAMNARYYEASFTSLDNPKGLPRIRRLRDPAIAHRVRRLRVKPGLEPEIWAGNLSGISHLLQENIQTMTDTVICLNNVVEFSLEWVEMPTKEDILPFLTAAMKTFGPRLRKVDFKVTLRYLPALLSVMNGFTALRHLAVNICHFRDSQFGEPNENLLTTALAPFINKVAPTLCILSIHQQMDGLDMSKLFSHLTCIPNLRQFKLSYDRPVYIPADLLSVTLFLRVHAATLCRIQWTAEYDTETSEEASTSRLHLESPRGNELNGVIFPNLLTLAVPVPATPSSFSFDLTKQYIWCSPTTLSSLELWDRYITFDEVKTVTSIFVTRGAGHKLQELRIKVEYLSPELIQLLAKVFPRLKKLAIVSDLVVGEPPVEELHEGEIRDPVDEFETGLWKCDFYYWRLEDVYIVKRGESGENGVSMVDDQASLNLMCVLANCILSVRKFCGLEKHKFLGQFSHRH